jgi:hypothetical protein
MCCIAIVTALLGDGLVERRQVTRKVTHTYSIARSQVTTNDSPNAPMGYEIYFPSWVVPGKDYNSEQVHGVNIGHFTSLVCNDLPRFFIVLSQSHVLPRARKLWNAVSIQQSLILKYNNYRSPIMPVDRKGLKRHYFTNQ